MYQLLIELKDFSAAHRLLKEYRGKCNHLHGHNYGIRITIGSEDLNRSDLVVDFSVIRKMCNAWVEKHIDHCTFVYEQDLALLTFLKNHAQKYYLLTGNTTVECLAKEIYHHLSAVVSEASQQQGSFFYLSHVELWESKNCGVIYAGSHAELRGQLCGQ